MDPRKLTARELLQLLLASRDEALWVEFVRRFQPVIAGVIFKRIRRRCPRVDLGLVDDLAGQTYVKILDNNCRVLRNFEFRHDNALHGFLKVVSDHVVEDHFRDRRERARRLEEDLERLQAVLSDDFDSSQSMERRILIEKIEARLQELADEPKFARDYRIFWLYFREGLTAREISELPDIGLTVKGIESTLLRLIKWLRGKLN
jgi:RNA polymerase sigma-70 factor (ECF subfamily)